MAVPPPDSMEEFACAKHKLNGVVGFDPISVGKHAKKPNDMQLLAYCSSYSSLLTIHIVVAVWFIPLLKAWDFYLVWPYVFGMDEALSHLPPSPVEHGPACVTNAPPWDSDFLHHGMLSRNCKWYELWCI